MALLVGGKAGEYHAAAVRSSLASSQRDGCKTIVVMLSKRHVAKSVQCVRVRSIVVKRMVV